MPKAVRLRQLSPGRSQRLMALREVSELLDSAFVVVMILLVVAIASVPFVIAGWLMAAVSRLVF